MNPTVERQRKFADIHARVRCDKGKSQEYMALELGISKKTVQNWEKGISSPSLFESLEWFRVLDVNPIPYYLEFIYNKSVVDASDREVEDEWEKLTKLLPTSVKRAMLFVLFGRHGSSPFSLVQLTLAHIHTPLKSRVINATIIKHNYEMAIAQDEINCKDYILPDLDELNLAIEQGKQSAIENKDGYSGLR